MNFDNVNYNIRTMCQTGSHLGLDRMKKLLKELGNPHEQLKFVHIAGTNGKGSITTMTANILQKAGYKVGKFTSPFVYSFGERICVNNEHITPEQMIDKLYYIQRLIRKEQLEDIRPTEFELLTIVAFMHFLEQKCDVVCLEVGLGGRLDSTNVINPPLVSVITKIGIDHTDVLGDSIEKIAKEKCGIIKNDSVVSYPMQLEDAMKILEKHNPVFPDIEKLDIDSSDLSGSFITYKNKDYRISLVGEHQIYNAITVIETCNKLVEIGYKITHKEIFYGLNNTKISGRMEILDRNPTIIFDGSHNLDAIKALEEIIKAKFSNKKITIIMGMLKDKECKLCVQAISKYAENMIFVKVPNERTDDPKELEKHSKCDKNECYEQISHAINSAKSGKSDVIFICGSFYLAQEIKKFL